MLIMSPIECLLLWKYGSTGPAHRTTEIKYTERQINYLGWMELQEVAAQQIFRLGMSCLRACVPMWEEKEGDKDHIPNTPHRMTMAPLLSCRLFCF